MIFKSYILEKNIEALNNCKVFLFYGENQGLKKEFKENLQTKYRSREILNFFQDEILKNKYVLENEISNKSLFQEEKVIFISEVNDKILEIFQSSIEKIDKERIFLFCDILDKRSKLRTYFEKSKDCGIAACYQDNEITIKKIISNKLNSFKGLTPEVINTLAENTGLDRNKLNNEIEKIQTYFQDKNIDLEKLELLLNIKINDDFNQLKNMALNGNKNKTNRLLADTVFEGENNIYYLNSINQTINRLNEIENLKTKTSNIEILVSNLKPPVFWKDKSVLIEQSKKWNKQKIQNALKKTYDTEIKIKSEPAIKKDLLIKQLIIELCATANSFSTN